MIDKPGRYKISFAEYLADPCQNPSLTRSTIKSLISETPRRAFLQHPRLNPQVVEKQSEKFDIGTAAHAIFLEGAADAVHVVLANDWRTNAAKAERDEAQSRGKIALLEHQFVEVTAMVTAAHEALAEWEGNGWKIADGDVEQTFVWQESNGIWCRTRPDWISKDRTLLIDYKSTSMSANPQTLSRRISEMGYDIQESFYRRGITAVEGITPRFVFLFQETESPYLCSFVDLSSEFSDMGDQKVKYGIDLWKKCVSSGQWPGYPKRTCCIDAPPWALASWELNKYLLDSPEAL